MNNDIDAICHSLSEKGQMIKNKVVRSIDNLLQQEEASQRLVPTQKKSNPKAKILLFGGLFCLTTGIILSITTPKQESADSRIEQNNKSSKKNDHGAQGTASVIMDILGVFGICSGTLLSLKERSNRANALPDREVDYSRYSSNLIESICSIKDVCSKEWDEIVMEHSMRCKQIIDKMECTEEEKIEKKESVTSSVLIKYNPFEIQQLIDSASSTKNIAAINDAVNVCSRKLQNAIDSFNGHVFD